MTRRPDIILLVLDAQRADRLSCYGCPIETSPQLDVLAAEATLFAHAVTPAQWTIPSHASMFTGLYPSQHTMFQQESVLPAALPTLAERLQQAGYFTAGFSNNPLVGILKNGLRRGFDSFLSYGGLLTLQPNQAGASTGLPGHSRQGFRRVLVKLLSRIQNTMAHSHVVRKYWFSPLIVPLWQTALRIKGNLKGDTGLTLTDAARLLIERRGMVSGRPVFCFINLMGTHVPFDPPRWAVERFAPQVRRSLAARAFLWRFNARIYHWLGPLPDVLDPERKAILDGLYNAEVAAQDRQVGIFLERLRAAGVLDQTLLMVVADHGEHLGEKQLLGHAFSAYEELIHVPLLIRDPLGDLPRGATLTSFVSTRRLFHTALAAAGAATPTEEALTLAQVNLGDPDQGVVFAEAEPLQSAVRLIECRRPGLLQALGYDQPHRAVYSGVHKLIAADQRHVELYAVRDDPTESVDLQQVLPEKVERLRGHLHDFVQQTRASSAVVAQHEEDLFVRQRLEALGYLE
ncbi:MAG: sulfatase [Anaerolineae bacterium]